jgi:hypothetical protein
MVATRVSEKERAVVDAAARIEGITVHELLRQIVIPAVAERVAISATEMQSQSRGQ